MADVTLERFAYTPFGTFGRLRVSGFECFTVERPWADNRQRESCIPEGVYPLKLDFYHAGNYPAYEVMNVPGRSEIKIHVGNSIDDVVGCIAPGTSLGWIHNKWAVSSSRNAFNDFMDAMNGIEQTTLTITQYSP